MNTTKSNKSHTSPLRIGVAVAAALVVSTIAAAQDAENQNGEFDKLLQQVRTGESSTSDVMTLVEMARENGQAATANQAVKGFMRRQMSPDPRVLREAADIATLAGDIRMAVNRYKMYLRVAPSSKESSDAAAQAYKLMVDYLKTEQDAYQLMFEMEGKHRKSVAARKFDKWFVNQAIRRRFYQRATSSLTTMLADANSAEKSELSGNVVQLLEAMLNDVDEHPEQVFEAVSGLRQLTDGMSKLAGEARYCQLSAAYLDFLKDAANDENGDLEKAFAPVEKMATEWIDDDPTQVAVEWILRVFAGKSLDRNTLNQHLHLKRAVFNHALSKLNGQRIWLAEHDLIGDIIEWETQVQSYPELSTKIGWEKAGKRLAAMSRDELAKYAEALKAVDSKESAILGSLTSEKEPMAAARAVWDRIEAEADATPILSKQLPAILAAWYGDKFDEANYYTILWQEEVVPFMAAAHYRELAEDTASQLLEAHWRNPEKLSTLYHQVDWIAWSAADRKAVFKNAMDRANSKQAELQQQIKDIENGEEELDENQQEEKIAELKQLREETLATVKELLETVSNAEKVAAVLYEDGDAKTPNQACSAMRKLMELERERANTDDKEASEKLLNQRQEDALAAYQELNKVDDHTAEAFRWSTMRKLAEFADQEGRIKMLEGELQRERQGKIANANAILWAQNRERNNWPTDLRDDWERELAEDYNRALRQQIEWQIENDKKLTRQYLSWMVHTKRGDDWLDEDWAQDVMKKIIDQRLLYKHDIKVFDEDTIATNYVRLVKDFFPGLEEEYPHRTHFAKWYVDEVSDNGLMVDESYWNHGGRDQDGVVTSWITEQWVAGRGPVIKRGKWQNDLFDKGDREVLVAYLEENSRHRELGGWSKVNGYNSDEVADNDEKRAQFFADLRDYVEFTQEQPFRYSMPSLFALYKYDSGKYSEEEVDALHQATASFLQTKGGWTGHRRYSHHRFLIEPLHTGLQKLDRPTDLLRVMPTFWKISLENRHQQNNWWKKLGQWTRQLSANDQYNLAAAYATAAIDIIGTRMPAEVQEQVTLARSRSFTHVGGIPVPKNDPRYPIFEAQLAYQASNMDKAWKTYTENRSKLSDTYKDLELDFLSWIIRRHAEFGEYNEAEDLARTLIRFVDSDEAHFPANQRGNLFLAYANIALQRQEFPRARAQYERIAATPELKDTRVGQKAQIKIAEIDRIMNRYDEAIDRLQLLSESQDPYLRVNSHYQLARINFDNEQYGEAREHLERVLMISPDHSDAHLLMGELDLKLKKLEKVTDLDIGLTRTQKVIVPGKPLRLKVQDKNLTVVGRNTNIEIRVWTKSGDEEFFTLYPFGDSKTDFQGSIPTALAPVEAGDHTLQLLGDDIVHYDFSDTFKRRANIQTDNEVTLSVATDATLQTSSTEILSQEELEEMQLRVMLAKSKGEAEYERRRSTLMEARQRNNVRPGNPFHVRVTDLDRSITEEIDTLEVSVSASSGDRIQAYPLEETDATSGQFDGSVKTAASPPIAFASDSQEGMNPNFAISPKTYPAWTGALDNEAPKIYGVDLNDNVALKDLSVDIAPNRRPTEFLLQTAFNKDEWETVGGFPEFNPWDGSLQVEVMRRPGGLSLNEEEFPKLREYLNWGWRADNANRWVKDLGDFKVKLDRKNLDRGGISRLSHGKPFVARVRGAFYVERHRREIFSLNTDDLPDGWNVHFSINGEAPGKDDEGKLPVRLEKGVHVASMIVTGKVSNDSFEPRLMVDTKEPPYTEPFDSTLFDRKIHPNIAEHYEEPPVEINDREDDSGFDIEFPDGSQARLFRLVMLKFDGDAPGFEKIQLTNRDDEQVLPTEQDFAELHENDMLEIVPGDRITVEYVDPKFISSGNEKHAQFLDVTYNNAEVSAAFLEYATNQDGDRVPEYIQMIRFVTGEPINFLIQDPDADHTPERDTVEFTAWTTGEEPRTYEALETEAHSGAFVGKVFPVEDEPERESEIKVTEGDQVFFSYLDEENTDPGIPWQREYAVPQVFWQDPELRLFDSEATVLSEDDMPNQNGQNAQAEEADIEQDTLATTMMPQALNLIRPDFDDEGLEATAFIGGPKIVELTFPTITVSPQSTATVYVQTETGRAKARQRGDDADKADRAERENPDAEGDSEDEKPPFDTSVPGTIALRKTPEIIEKISAEGFVQTVITGIPAYREDALIEGIYSFNIPTELGEVPDESLVDEEGKAVQSDSEEGGHPLKINGQDKIHVGFKYTDPEGQTQWITGSFDLQSRAGFQIYDRKYENPVDGMYVGETLYFEVIDKARDASSDRDVVTLELETESGESAELELKETYDHTGVFRGLLTPVFAGGDESEDEPDSEEEESDLRGQPDLPVVYGDVVTVRYTGGENPVERTVNVRKGADGEVLVFTKRFEDDDIAVQTQFTVAESYFELAKKHRNLGQEELAKREILQGKRLLEEAIRDFPDSDVRAQAEYLLANLALEFGNDADDQQRKKDFYNEAINRFTDIVSSDPDSSYAPKSQYKKALVYEKMGNLDKASEEYVKLSYRYPDNELVAETISRLGRYFWKKGKSLNAQAKSIDEEVERYKTQQQARKMYKTAAEVFGRLEDRFPSHDLAGKTSILSGQAYIQAEEFGKAVEVLESAIKTYDGDKTLVPQAMYWCADAYMRAGKGDLPGGKDPMIEAYRMFKNLTWDYPATQWAKYARGRLTTEAMADAAERSESD